MKYFPTIGIHVMNKQMTRVARSYHKRTKKFLAIPGMIGYEERMNLYRLVSRSNIEGHLIEFGSLLGASTASILAGLSTNRAVSRAQCLHVVDCFRTPSNSDFADSVAKLAILRPNGRLLKVDGGWLDFHDVFVDNIRECGNSSRMQVHAHLLRDFSWNYGPIGFVHLDLPKDWEQLCLVVHKIFHEISSDSLVLFQDFVYHWSAELIGFVGILLEQGYCEAIDVVDTTLVVRTKRVFGVSDVSRFENWMSDNDAVLRGIRDASEITRHLLDPVRKAVIDLAKLQYSYDPDNPESTLHELGSMLAEFSGYAEFGRRAGELLRSNFRLSRSFELAADSA